MAVLINLGETRSGGERGVGGNVRSSRAHRGSQKRRPELRVVLAFHSWLLCVYRGRLAASLLANFSASKHGYARPIL